MTLVNLLVINFIRENPGFVAWLLGGLVMAITSLIGMAYSIFYQRLAKLDGRVDTVEQELEEYEKHIGIGEQALRDLTQRIDRHMTEEEIRVWGTVKEINEKLAEIQVGHGERLAKIEALTGDIRKATPNGDIAKMLRLLETLVGSKG